MADRTNNQVIFTLTAETAKLQAGLDRAEAMLRNFSQKTKAAGVGDDGMGGLGGAIKIGAALKAVDVVFKTSAAVLENYNGPAKNFSSLIGAIGKTISQNADELAKAVPVFGQSLSAIIKLARGDDIKDAQAAEAKRAEKQGRAFALARAQAASRFVEQSEDLRETRRIESISDEREREVAKLERQKQLALKKAEEQYRAAPGAEQSRELRNAYAQVRKDIEIEYEARKADKLKEIDKRAAEEAKKAAEEAKRAAEDKAREQERWAREVADVESEIRQQQYRAAGNELAAQLDQIRTSYQERIDAAKKVDRKSWRTAWLCSRSSKRPKRARRSQSNRLSRTKRRPRKRPSVCRLAHSPPEACTRAATVPTPGAAIGSRWPQASTLAPPSGRSGARVWPCGASRVDGICLRTRTWWECFARCWPASRK